MPSMVTEDTNTSSIETGIITGREGLKINDKAKADTMVTTTITAKRGYQKSKFENLRKDNYNNKSDNKTHPKQYTQEELNELINMADHMHSTKEHTQKSKCKLNKEAGGESKTSQKSD